MEMKFEDFEISKEVKKALLDIGYIMATEIQREAIPVIMQGRDVVGQSQTGTGKTAGFGIPMIEKINPEDRSTQAIVLCPTRELAIQITDEIRKYTKYKEAIKLVTIYGGQDIVRQIRDLKRGAQIVIGTPGRVMDHMERRTLKLGGVKTVVLDEADEMLNMGFEEDIEKILKDVPEERQTLLFSATMNPRIRKIANKYLKDPMNIKVKSKELVVENIDQTLLDMKQGMKNETLTRLLDIHKPQKAIIFCNTKKKAEEVTEYLKNKGYTAEGIHGDIRQIQRERILKGLKGGQVPILVATDVAARGIDIEDLELVINYDIPQEEEYYVHRIGRTGRNGKNGRAYTFVVGKEKNKIFNIQKYANTKINYGKIPTVTQIRELKNKETVEKIINVIQKQDFTNLDILEEVLKQNKDVMEVAKALMTICTQEKVTSPIEDKKTEDYKQNCDERGNIKLFLNVGRKDNIMVKDIVGSMIANTAMANSDIGKVNILDNFSFVEIPYNYVEEVLVQMKDKKIKGIEVNFEIAKN